MDEKNLNLARAMVDLGINDSKKSVVTKMQDKQQLFRFVCLNFTLLIYVYILFIYFCIMCLSYSTVIEI